MQSAADAPGRILIAHPDRRGQRALHRILGAVLRPVEIVGDADALATALAAAPARAVVVEMGTALARPELPQQTPSAAWIAVPGDDSQPADADAMRALLSSGWQHVIGHPMPMLAEELVATVQKAMRGDLFGLEKYVSWGAALREVALADTGAREGAVAELARDVVDAGQPERVASLASVVADELLSNALYAAPVDDQGQHIRAGERRGAPRRLDEREVVTLRWACDGRYLGIEVRDHWGSLDPAAIGPQLAEAGTSRPPRDQGMGLPLVYACSHQLVINLEPAAVTEVIALVDVRFRPAELGRSASFHVFVTGGAS